mmetsp:Transcript_8876/g.23896  ORF Transcript_8876/g.23896 Transcript_8876/m.23896 type:complete len:416 (-) Transcript_8876:341-1588(-)
MLLDEVALRLWHAVEQPQHVVVQQHVPQDPPHELVEDSKDAVRVGRQLVIQLPLVLERWRAHEFAHEVARGPDPPLQQQAEVHEPSHGSHEVQAGSDGLILSVEHVQATSPEALRSLAHEWCELAEVQLLDVLVLSLAKQLPCVVKAKISQSCELELEQVSLRGVHVHANDARRAAERHVHGVAASAREREHDVAFAHHECGVVRARVLPRDGVQERGREERGAVELLLHAAEVDATSRAAHQLARARVASKPHVVRGTHEPWNVRDGSVGVVLHHAVQLVVEVRASLRSERDAILVEDSLPEHASKVAVLALRQIEASGDEEIRHAEQSALLVEDVLDGVVDGGVERRHHAQAVAEGDEVSLGFRSIGVVERQVPRRRVALLDEHVGPSLRLHLLACHLHERRREVDDVDGGEG